MTRFKVVWGRYGAERHEDTFDTREEAYRKYESICFGPYGDEWDFVDVETIYE